MIKTCSLLSAALVLPLSFAFATQADDTTITIDGQTPGVTPFISQVALTASDTSVIKNVQFTIAPKTGSVTRPLSGASSNSELTERGYLLPGTGEIFLPVYGLYAGYTNTVTLTYYFNDGSSKQDSISTTTDAFDDPCGYETPTILQARTDSTALSYDFMMVKGRCSTFSPAILDTDASLRWVGPAGIASFTATFFDNAVYLSQLTTLYRLDLDGTVTMLKDYSSEGVVGLHHNIDRGKTGLLLEADTTSYFESVVMEVDAAGNLLKTWNLADIISAAMIAGGDDPSQFVFPTPMDWFHQNATTYNRADDSIIVSSREDFVIALDYETGAIKWILGDQTKKWHEFPSLAAFALDLAPGSLPPIGQHATSITYDQGLLVYDNGRNGTFFTDAPGDNRTYAAPRKYQLDLTARVATEVWNYTNDESVYAPFCGSVYEDAPLNYLVDYAFVGGPTVEAPFAQLLGLDASGERIFYYQYNSVACDTAFNSIPLHLENTSFPTVGPRPRNLSTRGLVGIDEASLIGGFIVSGSDPETVVLRAIGPSLAGSGLTNTLADPIFSLYDAAGALIATNDDWESDAGAAQIAANGLAPTDPSESVTLQTLAPGAYTFVVTGKDATPGIGLVETYDLSPLAASKLANMSARGSVGTGDNVLIGGFVLGEVASNTVVIRAIGPSLSNAGIANPLADPSLTVYDINGSALATNDNWQDDISASNIEQNGLAPTDPAESATILHLPAGAYTAIVSGANNTEGVGLVEIYDL
ncbi:MAG: DVUA0089 family protein [Chthoniobacterales bacterium]|nr:DVUA0089 family protein [Chthoniobacterales bacterium]